MCANCYLIVCEIFENVWLKTLDEKSPTCYVYLQVFCNILGVSSTIIQCLPPNCYVLRFFLKFSKKYD